MSRFINLTGQRFGRLLVIERAPRPDSYKPRSNAFWKCLCDCGNESVAMASSLKNGSCQSCGCLNREAVSSRGINIKGRVGLKKLYSRYRRNAKAKNRAFTLNEDEFKYITSSDCFYCGVAAHTTVSGDGTKGYTKKRIEFTEYIYNGIDRIDSSQGYTKENSVPCCKICNWMKSNLTLEEFNKHIENIYITLNKRGSV